MVYPADDTVLRLRLLTQEVRRLAESVKSARESAASAEAAPTPPADAAPADPLADIRRAVASARRLPDAT